MPRRCLRLALAGATLLVCFLPYVPLSQGFLPSLSVYALTLWYGLPTLAGSSTLGTLDRIDNTLYLIVAALAVPALFFFNVFLIDRFYSPRLLLLYRVSLLILVPIALYYTLVSPPDWTQCGVGCWATRLAVPACALGEAGLLGIEGVRRRQQARQCRQK
jgi:hypothetical protein